MDKAEALKRLDAIEAEAKELSKLIDAPVSGVFVPVEGERCYVPYLAGGWTGGSDQWFNNSGRVPVAYRTPEAATAMAEAIQTMMEVQLHGGAELPRDGDVKGVFISFNKQAFDCVGGNRIDEALKTIVGAK